MTVFGTPGAPEETRCVATTHATTVATTVATTSNNGNLVTPSVDPLEIGRFQESDYSTSLVSDHVSALCANPEKHSTKYVGNFYATWRNFI